MSSARAVQLQELLEGRDAQHIIAVAEPGFPTWDKLCHCAAQLDLFR